MPRTIRFHLDEDVDPAIAAGLRRRGIDVTTSPAVGLLGARDPIQLAYARAEGRVFFTHDDDPLEAKRPRGRALRHRLLPSPETQHWRNHRHAGSDLGDLRAR